MINALLKEVSPPLTELEAELKQIRKEKHEEENIYRKAKYGELAINVGACGKATYARFVGNDRCN